MGKPSVGKIELHYFRTLDVLLLALKKGDIDAKLDYYNPVPGTYAADLIKSGNINLGIVPDVGVPLHLAFGLRKYPTNLTAFRQAISYAIDYQALVDMIAAGYGQIPGKGYLPPTVDGYNSSLPKLETNVTKAKEILDKAQFLDVNGDGFRESPNGSKLRIPITPNVKQSYTIRAAEVIKSQLNKIGLDAYVEVLSNDDVGKKINTNRDYYMVIGYSTPFANMMAESGATYFADMPGLYGTSTDPELTTLVKEIQQSRNVEELEKGRGDLQEYIAKEQPIIALVWGDAIYPYRTDRWTGWVPMYGYGPVNYLSWFNLKRSK